MRRWLAWDQPYLSWSWGRHWLGYWVPHGPDVAWRWRLKSWKHKVRKGRRGAAFVISGPEGAA